MDFDPEDMLTRLGHEIRRARKTRALSQRGFAVRCGLSSETIKKLEHGNAVQPRLETLARLCQGLKISLMELARILAPAKDEFDLSALTEYERDFIKSLVRMLSHSPQPVGVTP